MEQMLEHSAAKVIGLDDGEGAFGSHRELHFFLRFEKPTPASRENAAQAKCLILGDA